MEVQKLVSSRYSAHVYMILDSVRLNRIFTKTALHMPHTNNLSDHGDAFAVSPALRSTITRQQQQQQHKTKTEQKKQNKKTKKQSTIVGLLCKCNWRFLEDFLKAIRCVKSFHMMVHRLRYLREFRMVVQNKRNS